VTTVISDNAGTFKDPESYRDEIERREIEQADYVASLDDDGTVVAGPDAWFQNSPWNADFHKIRRTIARSAELITSRERRREPAGVSGMLMMATRQARESSEARYVEAAVKRILDKLRNCPFKSQDTTMNNTAFSLGRKIAGNWPGMIEHEIKGRFMDACHTLRDDPTSGKPKWKDANFEEKWQHGMRDGRDQPDPWPPPGYKPRGSTLDLGLKLLHESVPLTGTLGEKYFREARKVDPSRATLLRFHPAASCSEIGKGKAMAAVITAYRSSPDGDPVAVHVTYVGMNGTKPALDIRKRTFGKFAGTGAALYLMPVGKRTLVGEGIEKTLRCSNVTGLPGIAAGSASALASMAIPDGIEELIICADRGAERETASLAKRAHAEGRKVCVCYPPVAGEDWDSDKCAADAVREVIDEAPYWEPGWSRADDEFAYTGQQPEPEIETEPLPLVRPLGPAPDYPVDALGPLLGKAAQALYCEAVRAPLAVCSNSVLATATLAVQGHVDAALPHGVVKPVSQFLLSVLETGGRKTAADDHAQKAVADFEEELRELYDERLAAHQNKHDAWKAEREKIKRNKKLNFAQKEHELNALGREPLPPPFPVLRYKAPTIEGLIQSLRYGHPSAGLFTSEGGQFVGGHAMADDAKMRSTTILNEFWDGAPAERIRANEKFLLVGRRLSIHLQAQPDVALTMTADRALQDNGFLSRFLMSAPASLAGTRFQKEVSKASRLALAKFTDAVREHLRRELPYVPGKNCLELKPKVLRFSEAATAAWWRFHDEIEAEVKPDGRFSTIAGLANKLPEHAARITAVLTAFEEKHKKTIKTIFEPDEEIPPPTPQPDPEIDVQELERGIEIARYYTEEALRITNAASATMKLINAQKLLDWLHTKWSEDYIAIVPLVEFGPYAFRDTATMKELVKTLVEYGWLVPIPSKTTMVHKRPRKKAWRIVRK